MQNKSSHAHANIIWASAFSAMLESKGLKEKHHQASGAIEQKLNGVQGAAMPPNFKARFLIRVLCYRDHLMDVTNLKYGSDQNIGLHDLSNPEAMKSRGTSKRYSLSDGTDKAHIDYGYCPFCTYWSQNRQP